MLNLKGVNRRIDDGKAVDDGSVDIQPGSVVGVVGRSGPGKST